MSMRVTRALFAGVLLLSACAAGEQRSNENASSTCAKDEVAGPLGGCVKVHVRQACDECATDADCGLDATCAPFPGDPAGCFVCMKGPPPPPIDVEMDGGTAPACSTDLCEGGVSCCDGFACMRDGAIVCDKCVDPEDTCVADDDCGIGRICLAAVLPCSCDDTPHTTCVVACEPGGCPDGEGCGDRRICEALRCDRAVEGRLFSCPDGTTCAPGEGSDVHGCSRPPCVDGEPCEGGKCLMGRCHRPARCAKTSIP